MRLGTTNLLLKISSAVIGNGKTLPDIKPVLPSRALLRVYALLIEPTLDPALDAWKRQLGELIFKARVIGKKEVSLPFPYAGLR